MRANMLMATATLRDRGLLGTVEAFDPRDARTRFPEAPQKYVKEFEYRYNRRKRPASIFGELVANF